MRHFLIEPPTVEPVSVAEAKQYLRVRNSADDAMIESQIKAARLLCEGATRKSFLEQKHRLVYTLPHFREDEDYFLRSRLIDPDRINSGVQLIYGPVTSVDEVSVYLTEDASTPVDTASYSWNETTQTIQWKETDFLPILEANDFVAVEFTAGLKKEDFEAQCADLKQAVLITVAALYDQRGYSRQSVPPLAAQLMARHWSSYTYRR